jgi:GSCFA family
MKPLQKLEDGKGGEAYLNILKINLKMSKWINYFPKPFDALDLKHGDSIVQLGSCFSTSISERLRQAGFKVLDNPNGVIFHPLALGKILENALNDQVNLELVQKDDVFLDYHSSSSIYGLSEAELIEKVTRAKENLQIALQDAKLLTLTFGSAHGYRLKTNGKLVANCHQQPGVFFDKECTKAQYLSSYWKPLIAQLKERYPQLTILTTISPVRYSRDGWVENNRSKAQLIQLCADLVECGLVYFPSYEVNIDLLRDYRYFEKDGVHPNELAVDEVWELFQSWFFNEETKAVIEELLQLRSMENHRLLYPESEKAKQFVKQFQQKRESFLSLHASILW